MYQLLPIKKTVNVTHVATASDPIYDENFYFNGENHNFWEMVYVIDGVIGASADEKIFQLGSGEIIFHKPMEFHKLWSKQNTRPHLLVISYQVEGELMEYFKNGVFKLDSESRAVLDMLLTYLREGQTASEDGSYRRGFLKPWHNRKYFGEKVGALLTSFLLTVAESERHTMDVVESKSANLYNKVVSTMKANVRLNITISDIADMCGTSPAYLKKIFLRYSSYSIHKYFVQLKIQEAISLLGKDYSVLEISDILSFNNQNYFSVVFKRETGFAPMIYKKKFL